jgi:hypothetical protein
MKGKSTHEYSDFPLFVKEFNNSVKIQLPLSSGFLGACSLDHFHPYQIRTGYLINMQYKYYLNSVFGADLECLPEDFKELMGKHTFQTGEYLDRERKILDWVKNNGLYLSNLSVAKIEKILHPLLKRYFFHECCFLISYYSALVNCEMEADPKLYIEYLESIQKGIEDRNKIIEDKTWPVETREALKKVEDPISFETKYPFRSHRKVPLKNIIKRYKAEIRTTTTTKEEVNKKRIQSFLMESLYFYFYKEINPSPDKAWKVTNIVGKYALINQCTLLEASKEILNRKLYFKTKNEIYLQIARIFVLLGLLPENKTKLELIEDIKKVHLRLHQKYSNADKTSLVSHTPPNRIYPDGKIKPAYNKKEWSEIRKETLYRNSVKYQIDSIKKHIEKDSSFLKTHPYIGD